MENSPADEPVVKSRGHKLKRIAQIIYLAFISSMLFIAATLAL